VHGPLVPPVVVARTVIVSPVVMTRTVVVSSVIVTCTIPIIPIIIASAAVATASVVMTTARGWGTLPSGGASAAVFGHLLGKLT
jgi:hypothetical protein